MHVQAMAIPTTMATDHSNGHHQERQQQQQQGEEHSGEEQQQPQRRTNGQEPSIARRGRGSADSLLFGGAVREANAEAQAQGSAAADAPALSFPILASACPGMYG